MAGVLDTNNLFIGIHEIYLIEKVAPVDCFNCMPIRIYLPVLL